MQVVGNGSDDVDDDDEVDDDNDWDVVQFVDLEETDPSMARRLVERCVDRFMELGGLDARYRPQALAATRVAQGTSDGGTLVLRVALPLGMGSPMCEWDGTAIAAEKIVDDTAAVMAEALSAERADGIWTDWDAPRPGDPPTSLIELIDWKRTL